MNDDFPLLTPDPEPDERRAPVRSLKELLDMASGISQAESIPQEDSGLLEQMPFPFLALVGQEEMKMALMLAVVNPAVGGLLLIGPRGTGKTTAVRSLVDLLPQVERSTCFYGCMPEDIEAGGMDAVCPECAKKYGQGIPLTTTDRARIVELPLNARLEDVVGGLDERAAVHERLRLKRGILAQADLNVLFIDEVNLLADEIVDSILDAAAQGSYTVRRGPISASYRARFALIGSMNPEEGRLRPQIMDRFGLRVVVQGLADSQERLEAYKRVHNYQTNPRKFVSDYAYDTGLACQEIQEARRLLPMVELPKEAARLGIAVVQRLKIESLRAEITLFEAARALAAADNRTEVTLDDIRAVAPMALRMRRSAFMTGFIKECGVEDQELRETLDDEFGKA